MADLSVDDMNVDTSVGGSEKIPVSDATTPKYITPALISAYTIDNLEAATAVTSTTGADYVLIVQGGAAKRLDIDYVEQYTADTMWAKAAESAPDSADIIMLKDGGVTEKTCTLALLAEYVRATTEATILDFSNLDTGTLGDTDTMAVTQGTTPKKAALSALSTYVHNTFDTYVTALSAVTSTNDADVFYTMQGGVEKKITLANLIAHGGVKVTGPSGVTVNTLVQWSADYTLKDGLAVVDSFDTVGSNVVIPTTLGVRTEMNQIVYDSASIGTNLAGGDTFLVDDGSVGTAQRKCEISRIWTYSLSQLSSVTDVSAHTWVVDEDTMVSNLATKVPTQQSVKAYIDTQFQYDTKWIPALEMSPSITNGTDSETKEYGTNDLTHDVLLFDGLAQDESAEFDLVMPEGWDRSTIKYKVYWAPGHADANADEYVQFYLAAGAFSNDDPADAALGTLIAVEDQVIADDDWHITAASAALTVGGTPALGDMIHFKLSRNFDYAGAGSAMDVDARVRGVLIQFKKTNTVAAW